MFSAHSDVLPHDYPLMPLRFMTYLESLRKVEDSRAILQSAMLLQKIGEDAG